MHADLAIVRDSRGTHVLVALLVFAVVFALGLGLGLGHRHRGPPRSQPTDAGAE